MRPIIAEKPSASAAPALIAAPAQPAARSGLATQAQACAFLSVSRQYLWLRAREGKLQPIKFGRLVRYKWADLEAIATAGLPSARGVK